MNVDAQIDTLEAKGLIRVAAHRPELEYLFRHWLVQDAAYGSLLKQERRELHRQVGEALETLYPERRNELAGILAMHFQQAGDTAKAIDYLVTDARYALERNALREAFAAADAAVGLLPPAADDEPDELRRSRVEIAILRAKAGWTFTPVDVIVAGLERVVPTAEALGDLELLAQVHLHIALVRSEAGGLADDPAVKGSLDRLRELSEALDDPSLAALPQAMVAMNKVHTGPIREGVEALEVAIPMMERRRDFIGAAFARGWLAIGLASLGEFERAQEAADEATRMAAGGDLIAQLDAQISEAMLLAARGDLDRTVPLAQACVERAEETGATACAVVSAWVLGDAYQRQGSFREAHDALTLGLDLSPGTAQGMWGPTLTAWLRANAVWLGDLEAAEGGWEEPLATVRRIGNHIGEANILWKRAESAARRERWEDALVDYEAAARIFEAQGARPNLARVLRGWGTALRDAGRGDREAGDEQLRRALALFEAMGLEREAREVRISLSGGAAT
jgi:tetratricopeptide (TPR) repeat protein